MTENFPKLVSDTKPQTQEAQRTWRSANVRNKTKENNNNYT